MVGLICFVYYLSIGHYYTLGDYLAYAFGDVWLGLLLTLFGVPALVYWLGKTGILRLLGKDFSYS